MYRTAPLVPTALVLASLLPTCAAAEMRFKHHYINTDLPGKEYGQTSLVDVDRDGDLDICSKLWDPRPDNANGGRNHADYLRTSACRRSDHVSSRRER